MLWECRPKVAPDQSSYQIGCNNNSNNNNFCSNINSNNLNVDPTAGYAEPSANYCKVVFKITIVFLSFAGFLYQATDICAHYFSYRTVVYTNTKQESVIDLPSVTFCLPTYFTKETLINLYGPHIARSMDGAKQSNQTTLSAIESLIYESFQKQAFKDLKAGEILAKSVKSSKTVECRLFYPPLNWLNLTRVELYEIVQYGIPCEEVVDIIESINANGKCFTYFSRLAAPVSEPKLFKIAVNRGYRFHSGRFMKLVVQLNRDEYTTLPDGLQKECIQIHPPFKIPSESCLHAINPGMSYDVVLTKTKAILQPPPYQTDCFSYHSTAGEQSGADNRWRSMSRSDCIDKCMLRVYESKCKCLPIHVTIWKSNANLNLSICDYDDYESIALCLQQELGNTCYDSCKPDCIDRHYHVQVESRAHPSDQQLSRVVGAERSRLLSMRERAATINVWSDYLSDITYVHTPAMSLIQLVCYLGGLAGLWLGVSVMTVSGWLAQLFPFLQKWTGQQKHMLSHCKRHLQVGAIKLQPELYDYRQDELLLFHRPSICSVSQLNPRF